MAASSPTRNARVEALRLVAIAGIAVFHTFQTWFSAATEGTWAASAPTLAALGVISLLGAYGNHVFFLISGHFLVPRAAAAAHEDGYWRSQLARAVRRAVPILATVVLYALVALAVSTWVVPLEGVSLHEASWLVGGLEFIWVYLVLVLATPVMGWVWARVRRPRAVVAVLVVVVFAVNAYIAFVSPGGEERGLLEWRKLMSAVSYLVAFLAGGALAETSRPHAGRALACCLVVCVAVEAGCALAGARETMVALSFKSTSLLSFALAMCSVAWATSAGGAPSRAGALACRLSPSVLGFYVAQSMFSPLWRPAFEELTARAAAAAGEAGLLCAGVAVSLAFLALVLAADQLVRIPVLRRLGLA